MLHAFNARLTQSHWQNAPAHPKPSTGNNNTSTGTGTGTGTTKSASQSSLAYPRCEYTKLQLKRVLALTREWLDQLKYTVPSRCAAVLSGKELGGSDAFRGP